MQLACSEIVQATGDSVCHAVLWRHASMISRSVDRQITEPLERQQINNRLHELAGRTGGGWRRRCYQSMTAALVQNQNLAEIDV